MDRRRKSERSGNKAPVAVKNLPGSFKEGQDDLLYRRELDAPLSEDKVIEFSRKDYEDNGWDPENDFPTYRFIGDIGLPDGSGKVRLRVKGCRLEIHGKVNPNVEILVEGDERCSVSVTEGLGDRVTIRTPGEISVGKTVRQENNDDFFEGAPVGNESVLDGYSIRCGDVGMRAGIHSHDDASTGNLGDCTRVFAQGDARCDEVGEKAIIFARTVRFFDAGPYAAVFSMLRQVPFLPDVENGRPQLMDAVLWSNRGKKTGLRFDAQGHLCNAEGRPLTSYDPRWVGPNQNIPEAALPRITMGCNQIPPAVLQEILSSSIALSESVQAVERGMAIRSALGASMARRWGAVVPVSGQERKQKPNLNPKAVRTRKQKLRKDLKKALERTLALKRARVLEDQYGVYAAGWEEQKTDIPPEMRIELEEVYRKANGGEIVVVGLCRDGDGNLVEDRVTIAGLHGKGYVQYPLPPNLQRTGLSIYGPPLDGDENQFTAQQVAGGAGNGGWVPGSEQPASQAGGSVMPLTPVPVVPPESRPAA